MGRYTSVQSFSDVNQKSAPVPYDKASGGAQVHPDGKAAGVVRTAAVHNVSGSTAGAGSSHFHNYRLERRREMERLKGMDDAHDAMLRDQSFRGTLESNRLTMDARTQKNADKRKRRKEKQRAQRGKKAKGASAAAPGGDDEESDDDDDDDDDNEEEEGGGRGADAAAASAPAPADGVDAAAEETLTNDGHFLERWHQRNRDASAAAATTVISAGTSSASDTSLSAAAASAAADAVDAMIVAVAAGESAAK